MKLLANSCHFTQRVMKRIRMYILCPLFKQHGVNFRFDPDGDYSYKNIHAGDNVNLGVKPILMAAASTIHIGNNVMFGPEVVVIGGGHNTTVCGQAMSEVHEKTGNEDLGVVLEDDIWVGSRAIILRGVCVGRGSVIGAGAIVTKSVPPYAIVGGNPARVLRFRWNVDSILNHEKKLYPANKRLIKHDLERYQNENSMLAPIRK